MTTPKDHLTDAADDAAWAAAMISDSGFDGCSYAARLAVGNCSELRWGVGNRVLSADGGCCKTPSM